MVRATGVLDMPGAQVGLEFKLGFDDSLDVVGVRMIGGLDQVWRRAVDTFTVLACSAVVTAILALIVKHTTGLRLGEEDEVSGIDEAEPAETGYDFAVAAGGSVHARHGAEE